MAEQQIRFDDGAAYERMMGTWSRLAGDIFLDWLAPRPGFPWVGTGCGWGALAARVGGRCGPGRARGEYLPRLPGAAPGLAMDRHRLRQRRLHRAAGGTLRAGRGSGDRSV